VPYFIEEINRDECEEVDGVDSECFAALKAYSWPGNIRELRSVIHQSVITWERGLITVVDLPDEISHRRHGAEQFVARIDSTLESVEQEFIRRTLEAAGGNRTRAAEILRVSRATVI
jgi:transcriptional regulator with PAS, ATPase and Fis domain